MKKCLVQRFVTFGSQKGGIFSRLASKKYISESSALGCQRALEWKNGENGCTSVPKFTEDIFKASSRYPIDWKLFVLSLAVECVSVEVAWRVDCRDVHYISRNAHQWSIIQVNIAHDCTVLHSTAQYCTGWAHERGTWLGPICIFQLVGQKKMAAFPLGSAPSSFSSPFGLHMSETGGCQ